MNNSKSTQSSGNVFRSLVMVVALSVFFGLGTFFISNYIITPQYESSVTLYASNKRGDSDSSLEQKTLSSDIVESQQLVPTCIEIIKSNNMLQEVRDIVEERTGESYSIKRISEMLTVEAVANTEIIKVSVRTTESAMAREIANTFAAVAPDKIQKFIERSDVKIVDKAMISTTPVSPNVRNNTLYGMLAGFCLGVVIAILMWILKSHTKPARSAPERPTGGAGHPEKKEKINGKDPRAIDKNEFFVLK